MRTQAPESIALLAPGTRANANAARATPARLGGVVPLVPKFTAGVPASTANSAFTFALHPSMPEVASAVRREPAGDPRQRRPAGRADDEGAVPAPTACRGRAQLGSHNDQQSTWQALGPEGVKVGWGGHLGDLVASSNTNAAFTSITVSGNAVFSAGDTVFQYQVGGNGAVQIVGHLGQPVRLVDRFGGA